MKRAGALLMLCLSGGGAMAAPAVALPGLGADSHRSVVDVNTAPWRILGRVQTSLGGRCTGFAVAPTVMLTAAHCLWLPATRHYIQPEDVHVLMGYAMGQYRLHAQVTRFVIAPDMILRTKAGPHRRIGPRWFWTDRWFCQGSGSLWFGADGRCGDAGRISAGPA